MRTLLEKYSRRKEDGGVNPQARNKGILLPYQERQELEGYDLSNITHKSLFQIFIKNMREDKYFEISLAKKCKVRLIKKRVRVNLYTSN